MSRTKVIAKKLTVGLPFNLGQLEFVEDETQQRAAWDLYVELVTRISVEALEPDEGVLREALSSLYSLFGVTRDVLKKAGPAVAHGTGSLGPVAIDVLNKGVRPFLTKWHPLLAAHEASRPSSLSVQEHERKWKSYKDLRIELANLQREMAKYALALGKISGAKLD